MQNIGWILLLIPAGLVVLPAMAIIFFALIRGIIEGVIDGDIEDAAIYSTTLLILLSVLTGAAILIGIEAGIW